MIRHPRSNAKLTLLAASAAVAVTACGGGSSSGDAANASTKAKILSVSATTDGTAVAAQTSYNENYRPQFQFTPAKNWMNDPNGLVYYRGEYHLFYQYNPNGDQWGDMSWATPSAPTCSTGTNCRSH